MSKSRKETRAVGLWFGLCIAVILCIICPSSVAATSATDLLFQQTNWLAPDDTVLEADSRWGSMTFSYDPDPSTTQYLNLALANSADGPRVWAVQNLPLPYVDNGVFAARRETVHVNLRTWGTMSETTGIRRTSRSQSIRPSAPASRAARCPLRAYSISTTTHGSPPRPSGQGSRRERPRQSRSPSPAAPVSMRVMTCALSRKAS